eukprot:scaffold221489_cov54-Attheya_sp.AAC.2
MAPTQSKLKWGDKSKERKNHTVSVVNPPIPFAKPHGKEIPKTDLTKFECHVNPNDVDSDTFSIIVPTFRHGTCEELLTWLKKFRSIERGMLVKTDEARFNLVRQILEGEGRRAFDNAAAFSKIRRHHDVDSSEDIKVEVEVEVLTGFARDRHD